MKKYWVCIIEVERKTLPKGFDSVPRTAAIEAIEEKAKISVKECWSSWGCTEKKFEEIMDVWNKY